MSVLGSLVGVGCCECRRRGHYCQAQMWEPGEVDEGGDVLNFERPLCLRCADGDACVFETVRSLQTPDRLKDEVDLCIVPKLTESDKAFVAKLGRPVSVHVTACGNRTLVSEETAAAVREDFRTMSAGEVGEKYGLPPGYVRNLCSNWKKKMNRQLQRKLAELVEMEIGGEVVRMAPMAQMGAEMLLCNVKPKPLSLNRLVLEAVRSGCTNSVEVSHTVKASRGSCGGALSQLCRRGILRIVGTKQVEPGTKPVNIYALCANLDAKGADLVCQ